jgi:7,8-dihydropterin-6-yl-methyl-4-(beta-D-ribofuranosyl)aminobenzene 5'-phosphate synthase
VLFDAGLTGSVLRHNWTALEENPKNVDCIVLSHGHPDHYGGIYEMLSLMERQMPVICHDDAFLPRIALMGDGRGSPFYTAQFSEDGVERAGGRVATVRDPVELGWGLRTTGEIPRLSAFEGTPRPVDERGPGLYQLRAGKVVVDEVLDEQALVVDIRGRGLVCITGCGHAGVTNTIMRAIEISGEKPIVGVIGGFHLGFPTTPTENVDKTIDFLKSVDVRHVVPMHCTGLAAVAAMNRALGDGFVQPAVGTTIRVTAGNRG